MRRGVVCDGVCRSWPSPTGAPLLSVIQFSRCWGRSTLRKGSRSERLCSCAEDWTLHVQNGLRGHSETPTTQCEVDLDLNEIGCPLVAFAVRTAVRGHSASADKTWRCCLLSSEAPARDLGPFEVTTRVVGALPITVT